MPTGEELRAGVYEIDGSWRDIYVLHATREDWQHWIAHVNRHYQVRWEAEDHLDGRELDAIDAAYMERRWDAGFDALVQWANVFVGDIKLNCHFFVATQIDNDFDPAAIRSMEDHHRLMGYLVAISTALQKEVIVTAENVPEGIYIRVNGTDIHFM